jgi:hypothetical protein
MLSRKTGRALASWSPKAEEESQNHRFHRLHRFEEGLAQTAARIRLEKHGKAKAVRSSPQICVIREICGLKFLNLIIAA